MPNWVRNLVRVNGDLSAFREAHLNESDSLKVLRALSGDVVGMIRAKVNGLPVQFVAGYESQFDFNTIIPCPKKFADDCDWAIHNWGTKWNACSVQVLEDKKNSLLLSFNTAWVVPIPIYEKLAEMYPGLKFNIRYADEDIGSNCGTIKIIKGRFHIKRKNETFASRNEAFARRVWNV